MKKRKGFYGLLAFLVAAMLFVPAAFQGRSEAAKKVTPGTVKLVSASPSAYNKITVKWNKTKNATHYKIYYKKSGDKSWKYVYTTGASKSSYTHVSSKKTPITVGQKYTYTVKAYNKKYNTTGKYDSKGKTTATKPSTVKLNSAKLNSNKTVTVKWNKTNSCDSYKVYRKTGSSGWKCIATTKSTSYTDKKPVKGAKNTYTVRSYYSKTKALGNYNTKGVSVSVPGDKPSGPIEVSRIYISPQTPSVPVGNTVTLKANIEPENATDKSVTWVNANPDIIKLEPHGDTATVTALKYGTAEVEIIANDSGYGMDAVYVKCTVDEEKVPEVLAREVFDLTNEVRARYGAAPVKWHPAMQKAAMIRAKELEIRYAHSRPDGRDNLTVASEAGVTYLIAENIAQGQHTPKEVVQDWENSSGHLVAMVDVNATYMGVGYHKGKDGTNYWVQLFSMAQNESELTKMGTLTFDATGGTGGYTVTLPWESGVYLEDFKHPLTGAIYNKSECVPTPTRDGYTFLYWTDEYGNRVKLYTASNCTVYAKWQKN